MSIRSIIFILLMAMLVASCTLTTASSPPATVSLEPQSPDFKSETFTAAYDDSPAATVNIDAAFEKVFVSASTDSANLLDAEIEYLGDIAFTNENGEVTLAESGTLNLSSPDKPLRWSVLLHPSPALTLNLEMSSGEMTLDASELNLTALDLRTSSGTIDADVPATTETLKASADIASGEVTVNLADNAVVDFTGVEVSSGEFTLNIGADANVSLENVAVASGFVKVDLAPDTAVRIEIQEVGSGMVNFAYPVVRLIGTDPDEGIWETDGFARAQNQVSIVVTSIASGSFELE